MLLAAFLAAAVAAAMPGEIPIAKPGIAISDEIEEWPAIASDGDGYLVAWTGDAGVLASRFRAGGEMIDLDPIVVSTQPHVRPRVVWIGSAYLVTYANRFALVSTAGTVLREDVLPFPPDDQTHVYSAVAWNGRNLIVAATASLAVYDDRLRLVRDPLPRPAGLLAVVATAKGFAAIRWDGTITPISDDGVVSGDDVVVSGYTWAAGSNGQRIALFQNSIAGQSVTILDSDLHVIAKKALAYEEAAAPKQTLIFASEYVVAASRQGFLVTWDETVDGEGFVYLLRVTADGDAVDAEKTAVTPSRYMPVRGLDAASNGRDYLVSWNDGRRSSHVIVGRDWLVYIGHDVWGASVPASGPPRTLPLVLGPAAQTQPVAASNGRIALVAWSETTTDPAAHRILAARVTAGGAVLDATPIDLGAGGMPAAIASDGEAFLVVSRDYPWSVRATIVLPDGSVGPGSVLTTENDSVSTPSVAFGGESYFVVWRSQRLRTSGVRIRRDGQVLDSVPFDFGEDGSTAIAFDGARFWIPFRTEARPFNGNGFAAGPPVAFGGKFEAGGSAIACRSNRCAVTVYSASPATYAVAVLDATGIADVAPHGALVAAPVGIPFLTNERFAIDADDAGFLVTGSAVYSEQNSASARDAAFSRDGQLAGIDGTIFAIDPFSPFLQPLTITEGRRAVVYSRAIEPNHPRVVLRFVSQPRRRVAQR